MFEIQPEVDEGEDVVGQTVKTDTSQDDNRDEYQADNAHHVEKIEEFVRSLEGSRRKEDPHQRGHAQRHPKIADRDAEYVSDERISGIVTVQEGRDIAE